VQQSLTEKNISDITQPPYSPDLAPSDFWLFPILKMGLMGAKFAAMEDIKYVYNLTFISISNLRIQWRFHFNQIEKQKQKTKFKTSN
jgi:hypothetical protein